MDQTVSVQGDEVRGLTWANQLLFMKYCYFGIKLKLSRNIFSPSYLLQSIFTSRFLSLAAKIIYLSSPFSLAASLCTSARPFSWLTVYNSTGISSVLCCFSRPVLLPASILPFLMSFYLRWSKVIIALNLFKAGQGSRLALESLLFYRSFVIIHFTVLIAFAQCCYYCSLFRKEESVLITELLSWFP